MLPILLTVLQAVPPQDSALALIKRAHGAEQRYEVVAHTRAPTGFVRYSNAPCDEYVGRFCLTYEDTRKEPPAPPEPEAIARARDRAVLELEAGAAVAPSDSVTARALVRLLVESRKDSAAVVAARRFQAASPGAWADLLLGFALHAAGDDTAAVSWLDRGMSALTPRERSRVRIEPLVAKAEWKRVEALDSAAKAGYEAALWKLADPLYLTAGNEVRAEHLARYVWSRMLSALPLVVGMLPWGDDLEELTLRYGAVTRRERVPAVRWDERDSYIEHYDAAQLAFLPESLLLVGVRPTPPPGEDWPLEDARARSGYAAATVRKVVPLAVQVTRFPAGDSVVFRVDAALPFDSVRRAARGGEQVRAALFVLPGVRRLLSGDTTLLRSVPGGATVRRDSAWFTVQTTLPPGDYVYSAEALDSTTRLAGRARHAVQLLARPAETPGAPILSDLLVSEPLRGRASGGRFGDGLRGIPGPLVAPGDTLGLYAEVSPGGRGPLPVRYRVQLELVAESAPAAPARVLAWLRGRPGSAGRAARLGWTVDAAEEGRRRNEPPSAPLPIATDMVVPRVPSGLYQLRLRVTDEESHAGTSTIRVIRIQPRG